MKKRTGIFVIYNRNGEIEGYVSYLLQSLKLVLSRLVVVVNGDLKDEESDKLQILADEIMVRENVGYDGGAYKEALLKLFSSGGLLNFDELVLCNDSFYGPLIPWKHVFETMGNENADFWGLTKWLEGPSSMPGHPSLPEHVQAYFLVISRRMFMSECFIKFWEKMKIPSSYDDAIWNFEVAFTTYFCQCGFQYKTWLDVSGGNQYLKKGTVVYCSHMADLAENCKFPVIKRKAISLLEFEQYLRVLQYVKTQGGYKSVFLEEGWRQYEETQFPYENLDEFYSRHEKVYVFGYGKWGKALEKYFRYKGWKIDGFIVSPDNKADNSLLCMDDLYLNDSMGIIVALGEKNGKEVVPVLSETVPGEHLLIPADYRQTGDDQWEHTV